LIGYFDTSALVKLLMPEAGSAPAVDVWAAADVPMASLLLYVEARAAIARARRGQRLTRLGAARALAKLDVLLERLKLIRPTREVVWRAAALAEVHALRGYDAVHLASALEMGPDTTVVTADRRLAEAARAEGLAAFVPA
jgi:uncharacterized protein